MSTNSFTNQPRVKSRRNLIRPTVETLEQRCVLASFLVNSAADPGDGICDPSECTLREAIVAANAAQGADDIQFRIGTGPVSIRLQSALPAISDSLSIDGTTQPGFPGTAIVELDGAQTLNANGLVVNNTGSTIRGLLINRFGGSGIILQGGGGHIIAGNFIGTNVDRRPELGNGAAGIFIQSSLRNEIGGPNSTQSNVIGFNGGPGVMIESGAENSIRGNSIFSNGGLGIDLAPNGPNFPQDPDPGMGANNSQNFPVLTSATTSANGTNVVGSLNSTPGTDFIISYYASSAPDPTGFGEGEVILAQTTLTTDPAGNARIDVTLPNTAPAGSVITATATNSKGDTSEFSQAVLNTEPSFQFSTASYTVAESGGQATVTVLRTNGDAGQFTVDIETSDGTAKDGSDYATVKTILIFKSGITSLTIDIPVQQDSLDEADETINVQLKNPSSGAVLGNPNAALVTITDDDPAPSLTIDDVTVTETDSTTVDATFTVSLSAISGQDVSVFFATADGSATAPADYTGRTQTLLIIPAGAQSGTITVAVAPDLLDEASETFLVNLSDAVNATIADPEGLGTILDNDPTPTLSIDDITVTEGDSTTVDAVFTVSLSAVSGQDVSVFFATADGSATAPADYAARPQTLLNIPAGTQSATITVVVAPDLFSESTETFFVNLSNAVNATLADPQGLGTILDNDLQIDLDVRSFVTSSSGAADQLEIQFDIVNLPAPSLTFAFFASNDARFDNSDAEQPPRLVVTDRTQLTVGLHTIRFSGGPYRAILNSIDTPFVVVRGQVRDAAGNAVAESDGTNNDINFIGVFHEPGGPLVIRGKDDTDRYADNPDDTVSISGGPTTTVRVDSLRQPIAIPSASISQIRALGLGGGDSIIAATDTIVPILARGGSGDDTLVGGRAADSLAGNDGSDVLGGRLGNDTLDGGSGEDTADFSVEAHGVVANLATGRAKGQGKDTLRNVEHLNGSTGKDRLTGNGADNVLFGGPGADLIVGGGGEDTLNGGDGNDSIFGEAGDDEIDGGTGNDSLFGGDGKDVVVGGDGNDHLEGGNDDDEIRGGSGADFMCGGAGNDLLAGNTGNDSVIGESGIDRLLGGSDFDAILFDSSDLAVDLGGSGRDGGKTFRFGD